MAGMQGPAVSGKDIDAVPGVGLVSDSADSMDVSRRQSIRYSIFVFSCCMQYIRNSSAQLCHDLGCMQCIHCLTRCLSCHDPVGHR